MKYSKLIILLCLFLGLATVSCRDIDNEKDLDEQLDGTREIKGYDDIEGLDPIDNADTLDIIQELDGVGRGVYRANDIPEEDSVITIQQPLAE